MPLLIKGHTRIDPSQAARELIDLCPELQEQAKRLRSQPAQTVGPKGLLYIQQREFAATTPKDGSVSILGSDDATTCHLVVLRHTGSGAICLTHCDGSDTETEVLLITNAVKVLSPNVECGRLELHLVGGFSDDRNLSQQLTKQLLRAFDRLQDSIHLVTFCVTELNDRQEKGNHFPFIYGIAANVKTGEIFNATFPDRGPDEDLRSASILTGAKMVNIYDSRKEQLCIGPYFWMPFPHVDFWLEQDDQHLLQVRDISREMEHSEGALCQVSFSVASGQIKRNTLPKSPMFPTRGQFQWQGERPFGCSVPQLSGGEDQRKGCWETPGLHVPMGMGWERAASLNSFSELSREGICWKSISEWEEVCTLCSPFTFKIALQPRRLLRQQAAAKSQIDWPGPVQFASCEQVALVLLETADSQVVSAVKSALLIIITYLQNLSTSPLAEPPHFVSHIRATLTYLKEHPFPDKSLFPSRKPWIYRKNADGLWERVSSDQI
uniref:N-terminal asparagine amidase n=1 Tax=Salvator merianae TaxID=96440 RepID=A0A8D0BG62_SALMN